jgi:hypothetical protein
MISFLNNLFKKDYLITIKGHFVFVTWCQPIEKWSLNNQTKYLPLLKNAISKTVSSETWELLQKHEDWNDNWYQNYINNLKQKLCNDFNLDMINNEVETCNYHSNMLVIRFKGKKGITYPNYYYAIQLKPYLPQEA